MPVQQSKNVVADKLAQRGFDSALNEFKDKPVEYGGGGGLPAGINGGVAELTEARLGTYEKGDNKGELYVYMSGTVLAPSDFVGRRTSKMIPLCDDPPSFQNRVMFKERVDEALNELKKLKVDTTKMKTKDDFINALATLQEIRPTFKFHTWAPKLPDTQQKKGEPTKFGRVREDWDGLETGSIPDNSGGLTDNTTQSDTEVGSTQGGRNTTDNNASSVDWDALGEKAHEGDDDAKIEITKALQAQGLTEADIDAIPTWQEAAKKAAGGLGDTSSASTGGDEAPAPWQPEPGHIYMYQIKGARQPEEHEVTHVFAKTVTLRRVKDNRVEKGVSWSADPDMLGGKPLQS